MWPSSTIGWRPSINATRRDGWPSSSSRERPACDASSSASSRTTSLTGWICRGYSKPWAMRTTSWVRPMRPRNRTTNHSPWRGI